MNAAADPSTVIEDVSAAAERERAAPPAARKAPDPAVADAKRAEPDDDDSTSSTTTDNSNVEDVSEKDNKSTKIDRDRGNKQNKTGQGNIRSTDKPEQTQSAAELNAKSKPVKKNKAKVTNSLPNLGSLELPYKPKTIDDKKEKKKRSKAPVAVSVGGTVSPSSSVSSESAPPVWDAPSGAGADEAFGLLSQQTESFARGVGLPARTSFASVVSGQGERQRTRAPPVGKIAPEMKQPAADPGPIGPRHRRPSPPLGLAAVRPTEPDLCAPPPPPPQVAVKPMPPVDEPSSFGLHSLANTASSLWPSFWSAAPPPAPTFMQTLQADRRLKVHQYEQQCQQRARAGSMDDWPGFGSSPFAASASLWEPAPAPGRAGSSLWDGQLAGAWSPAAADPARPPAPLVSPFATSAASSPWAPRATTDSGWPKFFPADDSESAQ
ncbi:WW domain-binding protein 11-like [Pollicipes pollicipes]|uniref:WW domain-binding protein 11-like n=1 Tax=Pollicipes pollicipes TaxID=41117 RepID=UPI001884D7A0|nr:WW domain-binding protein 11-like [Pollicipes pollicipes]